MALQVTTFQGQCLLLATCITLHKSHGTSQTLSCTSIRTLKNWEESGDSANTQINSNVIMVNFHTHVDDIPSLIILIDETIQMANDSFRLNGTDHCSVWTLPSSS